MTGPGEEKIGKWPDSADTAGGEDGVDLVEELAGAAVVAALAPADVDRGLLAVGFGDVDADLLVGAVAGEDLGFVFVDHGVGLEEVALLHGLLYGLGGFRGGGVHKALEVAELKDGVVFAGLIIFDGAAAAEEASEREQNEGGQCNGLGHGERLSDGPRGAGKVRVVGAGECRL